MAQLKELYEELNYPSKKKLLQVAKKRGISAEAVHPNDAADRIGAGCVFEKFNFFHNVGSGPVVESSAQDNGSE